MQIEQKLKRDYGIYLLGRIIPGLVGLLSIPVFLRLFGETVYGEFALIYSLFLLTITSVTGWLTQGIIRFYNETTNKALFQKSIHTITLRLIGGLLILAIPTLLLFNYDSLFIIIVIGLSLVFAANYVVSIAIHEANFEAKKIVFADSLKALFFLLTPCVFFFTSPLLTLLIGVLFSFIAGVLFLTLKNKSNIQLKNVFLVPFRFSAESKKTAKQLWVYGWPLTIWLFLATLLNLSDRFIVEFYFGMEKAGEYSAIYDVSSKVFKFLLAPIVTAIFPILVKLTNEKNKIQSNRLLKKAAYYEFLVFTFLILILIYFKGFLITEVFQFKNIFDVEPLIIPIFVGSFFWQLSMLLHKPLELKRETLKMVGAVLLAVLLNLILNIIFIPIYGYIVAAYTTIIGSLAYIISIYVINYRLNND